MTRPAQPAGTTPRQPVLSKFQPIDGVLWLGAALALLLLSLALGWVSSGFEGVQGWLSFLAMLGLVTGVMLACWRLLRVEAPPTWLAGLLVGAAVIRLAAGLVWFVALPVAGHGSPSEQAGYIMADAHERDRAAWRLADSGDPLTKAFQGGYRKADQYGGLLFLSALVYRTLGGDTHQPLLIVTLTSTMSALAVLFTWAFARQAWGERVGQIAALWLALYPEAVLLGSSQMREAFSITLAVMAFYGLFYTARTRSRLGLGWILAALLLNLPFSPPFTGLTMMMLALSAVSMSKTLFKGRTLHSKRIWITIGLLALMVAGGIWATWSQFTPEKLTTPLEVANWWITKTAEWQAHLTTRASGKIQAIFSRTPEALHTPLLLAYGVVQPFLPAALIAGSEAPLWHWISIWRATGWTLLLALLVYAPIRALLTGRKVGPGSLGALSLSAVVWLGILIPAFRSGGDQWDNPRYRAMFAGLQVALAAWAWVEQRKAADPWMRRAVASLGLVLAWFLPWYLGRYTAFVWPVGDLFKTLGLGIASAFLFAIWDWARQDASERQ